MNRTTYTIEQSAEQAGSLMGNDLVNELLQLKGKTQIESLQPVTTGQPNVPAPVAKTTKVIRAADLSSKTYLETEADVDAYVVKLKTELVAAIRAEHIARIQ